MNLPASLGAGFAQGGQKPLSVFIIQKNQPPSIPAIHHMINCAFIFHS
jgi:hypothetical protein